MPLLYKMSDSTVVGYNDIALFSGIYTLSMWETTTEDQVAMNSL